MSWGVFKIAWSKNGTPDTLGSESDDMDITDLTGVKFNQFMVDKLPTGSPVVDVIFNNTGSSQYAQRTSHDGGTDATITSESKVTIDPNASHRCFSVIYAIGIAGEEKLCIVNTVSAALAGGASVAPDRWEMIFKWADTTNTIDRIDCNNSSTGGYATDSNLSALGTD